MTRALILFAHPCPESFSAALHKIVVETLTSRGWEVDDCDLNAEGFQPVMSETERRYYHDEDKNTENVHDYVARLTKAEALVFVFPVWNYGFPAILKGFIDKVFVPGVSFSLNQGNLQPKLLNIKKLAAVTTYGGTRLRTFMAGDPPKRVMQRAIRYVCHPRVKSRYIALHDMDRKTEVHLSAHLEAVRLEMERF